MLNRALFVFGFLLSFFSVIFFVNPPQDMTTVALTLPAAPALPKVYKPLNVKDFRCLQENIYYEARNQSLFGQVMVGMVTLERTKLPGFSNSVCGVVHEHAQFSWTLKPHKVNMRNVDEKSAWYMAGAIAKFVSENANSLDNLYRDVAYYHTTKVHPTWANSTTLRKEFTIEDHVFYSKVSDETFSLVAR